jgi:hypothetical protein
MLARDGALSAAGRIDPEASRLLADRLVDEFACRMVGTPHR